MAKTRLNSNPAKKVSPTFNVGNLKCDSGGGGGGGGGGGNYVLPLPSPVEEVRKKMVGRVLLLEPPHWLIKPEHCHSVLTVAVQDIVFENILRFFKVQVCFL